MFPLKAKGNKSISESQNNSITFLLCLDHFPPTFYFGQWEQISKQQHVREPGGAGARGRAGSITEGRLVPEMAGYTQRRNSATKG